MLYFHLKLISVACPIREKDEPHTLTIAGYRSPPSLLLGATAGRAWLESSASPLRQPQPQPGHHLPQNFPNQTRQTLFKPPSILINITEWKAALDHAALGPDLVWCQLSESSCPQMPHSSLAHEVFDTFSTNLHDFTFLQSWFWDVQLFPPKGYPYFRNGF